MFERTMIDVTSCNRPNPLWSFTDEAGHVHRWHVVGDPQPATTYDHRRSYEVPTLESVSEEPEYDGEGEYWTPSHYECRECREHVSPGYCADTEQVFVAGITRIKAFTITLRPESGKDLETEMAPYTWPPSTAWSRSSWPTRKAASGATLTSERSHHRSGPRAWTVS